MNFLTRLQRVADFRRCHADRGRPHLRWMGLDLAAEKHVHRARRTTGVEKRKIDISVRPLDPLLHDDLVPSREHTAADDVRLVERGNIAEAFDLSHVKRTLVRGLDDDGKLKRLQLRQVRGGLQRCRAWNRETMTLRELVKSRFVAQSRHHRGRREMKSVVPTELIAVLRHRVDRHLIGDDQYRLSADLALQQQKTVDERPPEELIDDHALTPARPHCGLLERGADDDRRHPTLGQAANDAKPVSLPADDDCDRCVVHRT
jgi:hypothetical protein